MNHHMYLIHYLLIDFIPIIVIKFENLGIKETYASIFTIVTFTTIVIVLSKISYDFIETPSRSLINRLASKIF